MMEYFRGWRRKVGVVTLVMACVAMGGWVRSQNTVDSIHIHFAGRNCFVISGGEKFLLWSNTLPVVLTSQQVGPVLHVDYGYLAYSSQTTSLWKPGAFLWYSEESSSVVLHFKREPLTGAFSSLLKKGADPLAVPIVQGPAMAEESATTEMIPYWFITIPLTLISLWLLLSKPRNSTQTKIAEPIQDDSGGAAS